MKATSASFTRERIAGRPALSVESAGRGDLVLLLHGIGGNATNWRSQLLGLSDNFLMVAWDMRGYGLSDSYPGPLRFSELCNDILRVLAHYGRVTLHLVGLSMGTVIAFEFLQRHPGFVRSLTICSGTHRAGLMAPERRIAFLEDQLRPLETGQPPSSIAHSVARFLLGPKASREALDSLAQSISSLDPTSYLKALAAVTSFAEEPRLEDIRVPVHVVSGADDTLVRPQVMRSMARRIPTAVFTELPDSGHLCNLEQPKAFNTVIGSFLRAHAETS